MIEHADNIVQETFDYRSDGQPISLPTAKRYQLIRPIKKPGQWKVISGSITLCLPQDVAEAWRMKLKTYDDGRYGNPLGLRVRCGLAKMEAGQMYPAHELVLAPLGDCSSYVSRYPSFYKDSDEGFEEEIWFTGLDTVSLNALTHVDGYINQAVEPWASYPEEELDEEAEWEDQEGDNEYIDWDRRLCLPTTAHNKPHTQSLYGYWFRIERGEHDEKPHFFVYGKTYYHTHSGMEFPVVAPISNLTFIGEFADENNNCEEDYLNLIEDRESTLGEFNSIFFQLSSVPLVNLRVLSICSDEV